MSHDASKVLLGATRSNIKEVSNHEGSIAAGLGVRQKSDGTLSLTKADGGLLGISLGKSLDNTDARTSICRQGLGVPVLLKSGESLAIGEQVGIDDASGEAGSIAAGITGVNAICVSATITGVKEDGTEANVIMIDFPGGL